MMAIDTEKLTVAMLSIHSSPIGSLGSVNTGGMSIVVRETARELAGQGHRVDIFTAAGSDHHQKIAALHENVRLVKLAGFMICCTAITGSRPGWGCGPRRSGTCRI